MEQKYMNDATPIPKFQYVSTVRELINVLTDYPRDAQVFVAINGNDVGDDFEISVAPATLKGDPKYYPEICIDTV